MIATAAKSTAAPKLEKEADDIIADANQILNGLKAQDDAKDEKAESPLQKAKKHTLVEAKRARFGPERCSGTKCRGYRGRQTRTKSGRVC